jgi:anhydro-N-acetylmuramic acid kinase
VLVGLMSGTSLDGISAAVVRFDERAGGADGSAPSAELLAFVQRPYTAEQRERLAAAMSGTTPAAYCRLDFELGEWLAGAAVAAIGEAGVAKSDVSAVATHGHTVWHEAGHSTWQFGEAAVIAERVGVDVVSDFRVRDVAAGGQGAPLVSAADAALFAADREWRALQNLGGIGNVTIVPPRAAPTTVAAPDAATDGGGSGGVATAAGRRAVAGRQAAVRAFDTGPGVAVIDGVVRALAPALPFDVDGALARRGTEVPGVVDELLAAPYFASPPPKSTGRELFTAAYIAGLVERCRERRPVARTEDVVATAVALTARSIGDAYARFVPEPVADVLLSGGGARNPALFDAIAAALAPRGCAVRRFDELFFDGEAKEAVAFAYLGYLHLAARPGNVPSATGARGPRILGKRTPA